MLVVTARAGGAHEFGADHESLPRDFMFRPEFMGFSGLVVEPAATALTGEEAESACPLAEDPLSVACFSG